MEGETGNTGCCVLLSDAWCLAARSTSFDDGVSKCFMVDLFSA